MNAGISRACPSCHYTVGHAETCEFILGAKALTEQPTAEIPAAAVVDHAALEAAIAQPQPGIIAPDAPQPTVAVMKASEGVKFDGGKIRYDLLPTDVMDEVGRVLTYGANKYGERNWEKGMAWGRVVAAALRHTFAIMRGEDHDPETGYLHAAHAICCLMFLCGYQLRGHSNNDDRKPI